MNVAEYLAARGMSIYALHQETGIAYSTLRPHVNGGKPLGLVVAQKLEAWSKKEAEDHGLAVTMTAAEILGLASSEPEVIAAPSTAKQKVHAAGKARAA